VALAVSQQRDHALRKALHGRLNLFNAIGGTGDSAQQTEDIACDHDSS
jgi:hypothetical protein